MVRALGLKAACYRRLLYVCHSPGMCIERLRACWTRLALTLFTPVRLGGLETFGLLGLFLGPAVMAAFISVWRDWTEASS